jgi:hypothetical protein
LLQGHTLSACLEAVYHFNVAQAVPLDGEISFADVAKATGLNEQNTARITRLLMTEKIFAEPKPGYIAHSASSKLLATDEGMQAMIGHTMEGCFPASVHMVECLDKYKGSQELPDSPWAMNFGAPFFQHMGQHPEFVERFAKMMTSWTDSNDQEAFIVDGFDWGSLPKDSLVVDVGFIPIC